MPTFYSTVDVAADPEQVWEVIADVERWGDWMPGVKAVTTATPGGGEGAVYVLDQGLLGGEQRYRVETAQRPELLTFTTTGLTATSASYRLASLSADRTRAECTFVMEGLAGAPTAAIFSGAYQQQLDAEMAALKERCESPR